MRLVVNGSDHHYDDGLTATALLKLLNLERDRVAVVINDAVVRRSNLDATSLNEGDVVEVITMVGGG